MRNRTERPSWRRGVRGPGHLPLPPPGVEPHLRSAGMARQARMLYIRDHQYKCGQRVKHRCMSARARARVQHHARHKTFHTHMAVLDCACGRGSTALRCQRHAPRCSAECFLSQAAPAEWGEQPRPLGNMPRPSSSARRAAECSSLVPRRRRAPCSGGHRRWREGSAIEGVRRRSDRGRRLIEHATREEVWCSSSSHVRW